VKPLGEVPDPDLRPLYALAEVFVLPSLYEGFGLPVLEAMASGAPVIASDASSLPEVGGQAARYFDPRRVDALADVLLTVLRDTKIREKMSADGIERARRFSWQKTAAETIKIYDEVLN
jgi:glycosyltransferase involved in cell wall biosynthesis